MWICTRLQVHVISMRRIKNKFHYCDRDRDVDWCDTRLQSLHVDWCGTRTVSPQWWHSNGVPTTSIDVTLERFSHNGEMMWHSNGFPTTERWCDTRMVSPPRRIRVTLKWLMPRSIIVLTTSDLRLFSKCGPTTGELKATTETRVTSFSPGTKSN